MYILLYLVYSDIPYFSIFPWNKIFCSVYITLHVLFKSLYLYTFSLGRFLLSFKILKKYNLFLFVQKPKISRFLFFTMKVSFFILKSLIFGFHASFIDYFPKQNLAKISLIISSLASSPVISPKSLKTSFKLIAIMSIGIFIFKLSIAFSKFFIAF